MTRWTAVIFVVFGAALFAGTQPSFAQCELGKFFASDAELGQEFGVVSHDGVWAAVGAAEDDDLGARAGAVYIFRFDGTTWVEEQKLTASDGGADQRFGLRVSLRGDYLLVSRVDVPQPLVASVYVFFYDGVEWIEQQKLEPADLFGAVSLSTDGDTAFIGEPADDNAGSATGRVHIFERSGTSWVEQPSITANDAAAAAQFGQDVAVLDDYAVVGSPGVDGNTGAAYVFFRDVTGWIEEEKLVPNDAMPVDRIGFSVDLSPDRIAAGAPLSDPNGINSSGATYIYRRDGMLYVEEQKLVAPIIFFGDLGGWDIDLEEPYIAIGAAGVNVVHFWSRSGTSWSYVSRSQAAQGDAELYGSFVSYAGDEMLVGAPGDDDIAEDAGAFYAYGSMTDPCTVNGITEISCEPIGDTVNLEWMNPDIYDSIEVFVDGVLAATLPGTATSFSDTITGSGFIFYSLRAVMAGVPCCGPGCTVRAPRTIFVDVGATPPGSGTINDPYTAIQSAFDDPETQDGDIIQVAAGTYDENIDFLGKSVTLRSELGPAFTTIDGGGSRTVHIDADGAVLDGFTVTGGSADEGGGIRCEESPIIINNEITGNFGASGGAGIDCAQFSFVEITDNVIADNSTAVLGRGGGIRVAIGGAARIERNVLRDNSASYGGAIAVFDGDAFVSENFIFGNSAGVQGGGISVEQGGDADVTNNTITVNSSGSGAGGLYAGAATTVIATNTILWQNNGVPDEIHGAGEDLLEVRFCVVQSGWPGEGNIDVDPLFVDPSFDDYHLVDFSPCVDAGDNSVDLSDTDVDGDPRVIRCTVDIGADEFPFVDACNFDTIAGLQCTTASGTVTLTWTNNAAYDEIEVLRDGVVVATLPGNTASYDEPETPGMLRYQVRPTVGAETCCGPSCVVAVPGTWFVDIAGVPPGTGSLADPYTSIQFAISHPNTVSGSTIRVAPGTYIENIQFAGKSLALESEDGPLATEIDGNQNGSVVSFSKREGAGTVLEGFTIRNGSGNFFLGVPQGAGISIFSAAPLIRNNIIRDNVLSGDVVLGAGISSFQAQPQIIDNVITENEMLAGLAGFGCGIGMDESNVVIRGNAITLNVGASNGGGINTSISSSGVIERCIIAANQADQFAGAALVDNFDVINCTITDNEAFDFAGGIGSGANVLILNTIIYANIAPVDSQLQTFGSTVEYCDVQGGFPGTGNIDADPLLDDEFGLLPGSPCIDAGDPNSDPDPDDTVADIGARHFDQSLAFLRGDADGNGEFQGLIDGIFLLSYAFSGGTEPPCIETVDVDGDGTFSGVVDGIYLLNHQFTGGPPPPAPYPVCGPDPEPGTTLGCDVGCP